MKAFTAVAVALATLALVGCGVHQTEAPPLTGPSDLALSISVLAVPDSINQDGGSQSSIKVTVFGPNGKGQANVAIRLDMRVNGVAQDYGTLSARNLVTKADGSTDPVTYTAPPSPAGGAFGTCGSLPGNCVEIVATTSSGSAFQTAVSQSVQIRLVPPGVILPPADTPVPAFVFSPTAVTTNTPVTFDASGSCGGPLVNNACPTSASAISSYAWTFGDGTSGSGQTATHTYTSASSFTVTLTVTNARGVAASVSQVVTVSLSAAPTASFVYSPTAPTAGQTVLFNADASHAATGRTITQYSWIFGDGASASGFLVSHVFTTAATYNVTLSVLDDAGQKTTVSQTVSVTSAGGGGGATVAAFTFSPTAPIVNQQIVFNGSGSSAAAGHTLTSYFWDFGNLDQATSATPSVAYKYTATGTFTVTLTVTDEIGQKGKFSAPVTVAPASAADLKADFSISPTDPHSGQLVSFNANLSLAPGASITAYDWDFGDGVVINGQTGFLITHTYFTVTGNTFNIRLTVHDNLGRVATTVKSLTVIAGTDPIASFTVSQSPTTVGTSVTFDGALSSVGGGKTIVRYTWDFGDGSAIVSTTTPTTSTTHSYGATGTYVIRLTVTDSAGLTGATTRTLLVQ